MAITYRDEKGSPLTSDEVDENFRTIVEMIDDSTGATGVGIASITQAGNTITFHLTNATTQGPFELPLASFTDTGTWQAETSYLPYDLFTVPNVGLYLTLIAHTSGTEFDPALIDTDGNAMMKLVLSLSAGPQTVLSADEVDGLELSTEWRNAYVRMNNSIDSTLNVFSDTWVVGDTVTIRQSGVGKIILSPSTDVTINTPETLSTRKEGSTITLIYVDVDTWDLAGDLELAA